MKELNESKAKSLRMVELDHQQFAVELMSDNVNVNLTQMAKPYGSLKRPESWLKTDEACQYIAILSDAKNLASEELVIVKKRRCSWQPRHLVHRLSNCHAFCSMARPTVCHSG